MQVAPAFVRPRGRNMSSFSCAKSCRFIHKKFELVLYAPAAKAKWSSARRSAIMNQI
jgi:hypothetical protein